MGIDNSISVKDRENNLRRITTHPGFNEIKDISVPETSEVDVPGIKGSIPRGVFTDAAMVARVIVGSELLGHGLNEKQVQDIINNHLVPYIQRPALKQKMSEDEVKTLVDYCVGEIKRGSK